MTTKDVSTSKFDELTFRNQNLVHISVKEAIAIHLIHCVTQKLLRINCHNHVFKYILCQNKILHIFCQCKQTFFTQVTGFVSIQQGLVLSITLFKQLVVFPDKTVKYFYSNIGEKQLLRRLLSGYHTNPKQKIFRPKKTC